MKSNLNKIIKSNPIDQVAKRVTSKGYQYTPSVKIDNEVWDAPPYCEPMPESQRQYDLIGTRQYKMTVISYYKYYKKPNGEHKHLYLVRCDCGKYETRNGYIWRKFKSFGAQCVFCRHAEFLKYRHLSDEEKESRLKIMKEKHISND